MSNSCGIDIAKHIFDIDIENKIFDINLTKNTFDVDIVVLCSSPGTISPYLFPSNTLFPSNILFPKG